ncbi:hypothetical protein TMatcc_005631 [Talaromyces marneffei ATCC 18224]|uniref:SRP9 domain-containing protein n=1 Tax=Talaromyces marneffei (strain ATCC 18224 / CBS 334.59 / QM 7333) TaxID=441960 RepID=B6Q9N3_TALMQ|nr:conserved hypothetical protein [Talaromyces marneffei ATCC 18224]
MPYLPTPNAFLEQSSLLLEAYPDNTRITTKYSYPNPSNKDSTHKISKRKPTSTTNNEESSTTTTQTTIFATLTLKTYNPVTGICLKYKTNKAAEVGRLISGLGKLGAGVKITSATEEPTTATTTADVEMVEAPVQSQVATTPAATPAASAGGGGGGKKKKKGKGKK